MNDTRLYAPTEPIASGLLNVDGKNEIYWEASGNPKGKPALYLHGGPGSGLDSGSYRRMFDPQSYYLIGIEQRGCGRSRPLATADLDNLPDNNTQTLISDIENIRRHLGIESWLVSGLSWGASLALALAQSHPDHVSALVLMAVTTTSRSEVDWLTEGVGRIFPEAWEAFRLGARAHPGERLVEAYARRLASPDRQVRLEAARSWNEWESTHISLDPNFTPIAERFDAEQASVFATLVTHYWANDGFLSGDATILERMPLIADMPAVLIHGRRDFSCPPITPWQLHQVWPASRLVIVEEEGHGGPECRARMRAALDAFR
ncbi:prolyl aminopeptidase [Pandoraea pulmonicola]|uniref:Proline iminopeptidase n=1 Tax=Pandoraea pulmonicola TaxID=93221 RepID=A0AAJ4ZBH9_PANPU|nr:prolyl aminopeptidase [Pandoraea pulmonicola]AJC21069.1 prolyl aminopeptidase [Pandoraea pulmonicola]SUA90279.1 Proline iminopeptidase [Pandoraea pulmonicola]